MAGVLQPSDGRDLYAADIGDIRGNLEPKIQSFVRNYSKHQNNVFNYREDLQRNVRMGNYYLEVDMKDIQNYDENLKEALYKHATEFITIFEDNLSILAKNLKLPNKQDFIASDTDGPMMQLLLKDNSSQSIHPRTLQSSHLSKIIKISGIIVSISKVEPKVCKAHVKCRNCQKEQVINVPPCCSIIPYPRSCDGQNPVTGKKCPPDPFDIVTEKCKFVDRVVLKLQETPENVNPGEIPRTVSVILERYLVIGLSAGQRICVEGIFGASTRQKKGTISTSYIRAIGIEKQTINISQNDVQMKEIAQNITKEKLVSSIAPAIYGYNDIKEAVLCLMLGGSKKLLPDGTRLRGDINVLLMGDPGTAKSQLLKFVQTATPIGVYTSGKGSSAAGLTAAVNKDSLTGEFYLEGGALVLGDGGVVCIDEFDKMNDVDRVAIHEAMEQQTISIAKAGITAVLNARSAVLAAANPSFGRFNERATFGQNLNLKSTILSRFDMIFMIRDKADSFKDKEIVNHIMNIHRQDIKTDCLKTEELKNYINYSKNYCVPRLTESASNKLSDYFVNIRQRVREQKLSGDDDGDSVPITVRQLEAIIRISEALAKMTMSDIADENHVDEAIRLFNISTLNSAIHQTSKHKRRDERDI
ncbi:DNA replication licensing factor MCM5 [Entamoeba marina]